MLLLWCWWCWWDTSQLRKKPHFLQIWNLITTHRNRNYTKHNHPSELEQCFFIFFMIFFMLPVTFLGKVAVKPTKYPRQDIYYIIYVMCVTNIDLKFPKTLYFDLFVFHTDYICPKICPWYTRNLSLENVRGTYEVPMTINKNVLSRAIWNVKGGRKTLRV